SIRCEQTECFRIQFQVSVRARRNILPTRNQSRRIADHQVELEIAQLRKVLENVAFENFRFRSGLRRVLLRESERTRRRIHAKDVDFHSSPAKSRGDLRGPLSDVTAKIENADPLFLRQIRAKRETEKLSDVFGLIEEEP